MHLEQFSQGDSFLHKIDPHIKFIVFLPLVFVIALSENIFAGTFSLFLAISFVFLAKLPLYPVLSRLLVVNFFIIFLWLTLPFSINGEPLFSFVHLKYSWQGFIYTFCITLKANAIFLFTISILGTTEIFSLAHALAHLKVPKKLIHLFFFFYRYISVLHGEYEKLLSASKIRAFSPTTSLHTWKTYSYLAGMLFVRSYERSQRVYQALILRGFKGEFPLISHFRMRKEDFLFAFSMLGVIVFLLRMWK